MKLAALSLLAWFLAIASPPTWAGEKGFLGFSVSISGEGFFLNPTLKSLIVSKVVADSPAASAGMSPGDEIIEVEERQVMGAKAKDLQPYMQREVGQAVQLTVKKATGEVVHVSLVAAPKPR